MQERTTSSYQSKLHQIFFGLSFFAIILYFCRDMMLTGSPRGMFVLALVTIVGAAILKFDRWYWLFLPLLEPMPISFVTEKLNSDTLGAMIVLFVFLIRSVLKRETLRTPSKTLFLFLPFFFWLLLAFGLNPTGLFIFGSSSIGAKPYFIALVDFLFLFSVSRAERSESDMRALFHCIVFAQIIGFFLRFVINVSFPDESLYAVAEYQDVSTRYELVFLFPLFVLLFSRYSISQVLMSVAGLFCVGSLFSLLVLSGKRVVFGQMFLVPVLSVFFRRHDRLLLLATLLFVGTILAFVAAGQGVLYDLPLSVQRGLSVLPGQWDSSLRHTEGFKDTFREELIESGMSEVEQHPWMGKRGFGVSYEEALWVSGRGDMYAGHELMGGWHNVWLGTAVILGIPGAAFLMLAAIGMIVSIVSQTRWLCGHVGGYRTVCAMYFGIRALLTVAISYWSGSSTSALNLFSINFAMFLFCSNIPRAETLTITNNQKS